MTQEHPEQTTEKQILETLGMIYAELHQMRTIMEGDQPAATDSVVCGACGSSFDSLGKYKAHASSKHNATTDAMQEALVE